MFRLTPNLDRFAYGLPDPQDAHELFNCDNCGGEIYEGEPYIEGGDMFRAEYYCITCGKGDVY